ncbi:DUF5704 domain-containing protein [Paenibacillus larvae]|uniref:DUF5704 domain-containing protein n=1 Tax=Paenibacillus larvae TaxID=1464 RepID=UPI0030C93220
MSKKLIFIAVYLTFIGGVFIYSLPVTIKAAESFPVPPTSKQTIKKWIKSEDIKINPGHYWYSLDNGNWRADTIKGPIEAKGIIKDGKSYPEDTQLYDEIQPRSITNYKATDHESGIQYTADQLSNIKLENFKWIKQDSYQGIRFENTINDAVWVIVAESGVGYREDWYRSTGLGGDGKPRWKILYTTPFKFNYSGIIEESKEIRVREDSSLNVGQSKSYRAEIRTKNFGEKKWSQWSNVSQSTETVWTSDNPSIASVDNEGTVTAKQKGKTYIRASWKKGKYELTGYARVYVDVPVEHDPGPAPEGCTEPVPGLTISGQFLDPKAKGSILADPRGTDRFDVLKGIPTSEDLYTQVHTVNYLQNFRFVQMTGTCSYPVEITKTYELLWRNGEDHLSDKEVVTQRYTVKRPYSYWQIDQLHIYGIEKAEINNFALPSGKIILTPIGYSPPKIDMTHSPYLDSHRIDPVYKDRIDLGLTSLDGGVYRPSIPIEDWSEYAEKTVGKIKVKNDKLVFENKTVMEDGIAEEVGPTPIRIPDPAPASPDVLYQDAITIEKSKPNEEDIPSSGTITYKLIQNINGGEPEIVSDIQQLNPVTIHTPVVHYSSIADDKEHNQKTKPSENRSALILNRPVIVTIPTKGRHKQIPGYGERDYAKYVRDKQVKFPFDIYSGDLARFYPQGTWISVPVKQEQAEFFLPSWVNEGFYEVEFRTIAENAPSSNPDAQQQANLDMTYHAASQTLPIEVIGRLYDFQITDIMDFNWEEVFRKQKGSKDPTGNTYWVGTRDADGYNRGNEFPFILPVRQGSHPDPAFRNLSVKTGYHFKFQLKTMGNMFGPDDAIRITPTFYFADAKSGERQPVDVYYHTSNRKFVALGSEKDTYQRNVVLDHRLRNVSPGILTNTAATVWELFHSNKESVPRTEYISRFLKNARKGSYTGGYETVLLPATLRTFLGPDDVPAEVSLPRAKASIQQWYGEYSIPSQVYLVPRGTDVPAYGVSHKLNEKSPIFLKEGYLIINFDLETIRSANLDEPHLQYIHAPLSNQWKQEGFMYSFTDSAGITFQLDDGDVLFYKADQSAKDDFNRYGTH